MDKRIQVFVGAYGSGKTEIAINYTLQRREAGEQVAIADLDLVNPYFRSRELRATFEERGVRVLAPPGEWAEADLPLVMPEVRGHIENPDWRVVLDVGGDDAGSRALSRFAPHVPRDAIEVHMVVNNHRPWTGQSEGIAASIQRVQEAARLPVTAIVSNPNLGPDTTAAIVRRGHAVIAGAAAELGLPVSFVAVMADLAGEVGPETLDGVPVFALERHLFPPWYIDPLRHAPGRDRRTAMMHQEIAERSRRSEQRDPD